MIAKIKNIIENFSDDLGTQITDPKLISAINETIDLLDQGIIRVAEYSQNESKWHINIWIKKAILLFFKIQKNTVYREQHNVFYDKIPLKFSSYTESDFIKLAIRVCSGAVVRRGCFIDKQSIIMPSFVNIGAFIGQGSMIDTWATVGSCAQIGKNVHISGGAGIGGVLEPLQAEPTIIEDNCFIGARSEIVEGVRVGKNSVISMGVFIGQSTKIFNRQTGQISYGYVPEGSVVVPGSLPSGDGAYALSCAVIVKTIDEKTRAKVSINTLLRS